MKRIAAFALAAAAAAAITAAPATAATIKPKTSSASSAIVKPKASSASSKTDKTAVKLSAKEIEMMGYKAGYAAKISAANEKPKSYPAELKTQTLKDTYATGWIAGFKQHAYDEGVKTGKAQKTSRDWNALPPYEDSETAAKKWFEGYESINDVAVAGYEAGFNAYARPNDSCTVPTKYRDNASVYQSFYKEAYATARPRWLEYIEKYKEGYASTQTVRPRRRGEDRHYSDDPDSTWYERLCEDTRGLGYSFGRISGNFEYNGTTGFQDGCLDRQSGKPAKFK